MTGDSPGRGGGGGGGIGTHSTIKQERFYKLACAYFHLLLKRFLNS